MTPYFLLFWSSYFRPDPKSKIGTPLLPIISFPIFVSLLSVPIYTSYLSFWFYFLIAISGWLIFVLLIYDLIFIISFLSSMFYFRRFTISNSSRYLVFSSPFLSSSMFKLFFSFGFDSSLLLSLLYEDSITFTMFLGDDFVLTPPPDFASIYIVRFLKLLRVELLIAAECLLSLSD